MATTVDIRNMTRQDVPRVPFSTIASAVLPNWSISLAFVGETRARKLNERLRGKTYIPNVLSYKVGNKSGEIIICPIEAKRQAPKHGMTPPRFILYLFIHGILHLQGLSHGLEMEQREQSLLRRFATK